MPAKNRPIVTVTSPGDGTGYVQIHFAELRDAQIFHEMIATLCERLYPAEEGVPLEASTADLDMQDKLQRGTP